MNGIAVPASFLRIFKLALRTDAAMAVDMLRAEFADELPHHRGRLRVARRCVDPGDREMWDEAMDLAARLEVAS